jgi:hypothetical protein
MDSSSNGCTPASVVGTAACPLIDDGLSSWEPWSRQAVHQAERGRRAFTAAELTALALALGTSVPALFLADREPVELPGATISADDYQAILLATVDGAPLDGVEELIVALHDVAEVLSRPALVRLAKIGGVAEQVAGEGARHR